LNFAEATDLIAISQRASRIHAPIASQAISRRRRGDEVFARIKEISLHLFIKDGFDSTTVDDLVSRIGISRRTFFRYFASKEDVVFSWTDEEAEAAWPLMLDRSRDEESLAPMRRAFLALANRQACDLENTRRVMSLIFRTPALKSRLHNELARWQDKLNDALEASGIFDRQTFYKVRVQNAASVAAYMTAVEAWVTDAAGDDLISLVGAAFDALSENAAANRLNESASIRN
jgi:AcrR family transcriptional regulator